MRDEQNIIDEPDIEVVADEEGSAPDLQAKIRKLKSELVRSEKERHEYLDGWQRAKADLINYKKDEGKRFEEMGQFVGMGLIQELLPVLDSFDMAMAHGMTPEIEKGILLIRSQLMDVLKKKGIEEIAVSPGDGFNPAMHESMGEAESDHAAGTVANIIQKGYMLAGRVIRPARVRLSKGQ